MAGDFEQSIATAYAASGPVIDLGRGVLDGKVHEDAVVQVPLSMMNRHGLVAGATGTGKTKTLQGLAEQLSAAGTSVFVADVKGDLSGLATPGEGGSAAEKRMTDLGERFAPPASLSSSSPSAGSARGSRSARRCRTSARSCWARSCGPTRRRSRASVWCSTTPTRRGCRCWTSPTCARC